MNDLYILCQKPKETTTTSKSLQTTDLKLLGEIPESVIENPPLYEQTRKEDGEEEEHSVETEDSSISENMEIFNKISNIQIPKNFTVLNPNTLCLSNVKELSAHSVNTKRVKTCNRGMSHLEGGWPKEIDPNEGTQDINKFKKRLDKDPKFVNSIKSLVNDTRCIIEENSSTNLFVSYFDGEQYVPPNTNLSANTISILKDTHFSGNGGWSDARSVSSICFHPDLNFTLVLGTYAKLQFQKTDESLSTASLVWDMYNPSAPMTELNYTHNLVTAKFQAKNPDIVAAGAYNGVVLNYNLKTGTKPVLTSKYATTHSDPIYDLVWIASKTHSECVTTSTDGKVLWWDIRQMDEPIDSFELWTGDIPRRDGISETPSVSNKLFGGTSIEWMQDAGPTRYLIGTEEGYAVSLNKKPKKPIEIASWFGFDHKGGANPHVGPIYSLKRNPKHVKYFMTIGDWSAKLWLEELKTPILQTPYSPSLLTCGGWSPTRAGVFYTGRADGKIDFYDYTYKMNNVVYTFEIPNSNLYSVSSAQIHPGGGKVMAVGDSGGNIHLVELCESLAQGSSNEKAMVGSLFDLESKREKDLAAAQKLSRKK